MHPAIDAQQVVELSRAEAVYGDLTPFRIELVLEADGWHIVYELKNPALRGGGPHYVIDAGTGDIVSKKYYQ